MNINILLSLFLYILIYIIAASGIMQTAKKLNINNTYLAFIPIANIYLLGKCATTDSFENKKTSTFVIKHLGWILELISILPTLIIVGRGNIEGDNTIYIAAVLVLFIKLLASIVGIYYVYKIAKKLGFSGYIQAIIYILCIGNLIYVFLGFLKPKNQISNIEKTE